MKQMILSQLSPQLLCVIVHQFLTGPPLEVCRQLHAAGEIDDLEQLIQKAKLLMTIDAENPGEKLAAYGDALIMEGWATWQVL